jgi:cytochrome c oxidase subunit 4
MNERLFRSEARRIAVAWAALVALMLTSLGSAYLRLGAGNLAVGIAIAAVKSAIVVWLFMRLRSAPATLRIVAATGLATLFLLAALSSVDYATRSPEPAAFQPPRQAPSFAGGNMCLGRCESLGGAVVHGFVSHGGRR